MPIDDLFTALNLFKQGVQDFQVSESINQANAQVAQIRASQDSEAKKRQQLQALSEQLTLQLAAGGSPATTVQSVAHAIAPRQLSPDQALFQAIQAGDEEQKQAALEYMKLAKQDEIAVANEQRKFLEGEHNKERELKKELLGMKAGQLKPLTDNTVKDIQKYDEDLVRGKDLLQRFQANKLLVGPQNSSVLGSARALTSPEFAAFKADVNQWFDAYRLRVTGAGASEGELKALSKNRPQVTDPPDVFQAKLNSAIGLGSKIRVKFLQNLAKNKKDVSAYLDESPLAKDTVTTAEGSSLIPVKVRNKQTGQVMTVYKDPKTGRYYNKNE